jgi:hypothetical protein
MSLLCAAGIIVLPSLGGAQTQSVGLQWTAPGDDGMVGTASQYDLRWSLTPITAANFAAAIRVTNTPPPVASGNRQTFTVTGLLPNTSYYFALKTADERANWSAISNVIQRTTGGTTVGVDDPAPLVLSFSTPYPNPARSSVRMTVTMPTSGDAVVQAFDISGRLVQTIARGPLPAGRTELRWQLDDPTGRSVPAGAYIVLARIGGQSFTRRVTVVS